MVSVLVSEVPPPGAGVTTAILSVPAFAISAAVMAIVSCVLLTKVVVRLIPLTCAAEVATKPVPLSVRLKAALPAVTVAGSMLARVGAGLLLACVMVTVCPAIVSVPIRVLPTP